MKTELGRNVFARGGFGRTDTKKAKGSGSSTGVGVSTEIMERLGLACPPRPGIDGESVVDVKELETHDPSGDWMTRLVSSDIFRALPPDNIQRLFAELETIDAEPGDVIVEQGTFNEFLYIVAEGKCVMSRLVSQSGPELMLGVLEVGDTFGEEALLCGARHNVSVKVLQGGLLMRLPRHSFEQLVSGAALKGVAHAEACALVRQGAVWLDVRMHRPPEAKQIAGSLNIPLNALRFEAAKLDRAKTYIVFAENMARRSSGAFLLARQGLDVCYLRENVPVPQDEQQAAIAPAPPAAPEAVDVQQALAAAPRNGQAAAEVAALREQLASMRAEMEIASGERRQMADSARELRQRYDDALHSVQTERDKCEALEIRQALAEADVIRSADSVQAKLDAERAASNQKLQVAEREREKLTAHLNAFNQRLKAATQMLKDTQLERDTAISRLATDRARFEHKLEESEERAEQATSGAQALREERKATVMQLEQATARLESRLAETEGRLEDSTSTLQAVQQERRDTVSQLEQERARLESRLAETEGRLADTASTLQELQLERRATVSQLEQERARLETRVAEAEGRLQDNIRCLAQLEGQLQEARGTISALEGERSRLEARLQATEAPRLDDEQSADTSASVSLVTERLPAAALQAQQTRIEAAARRARDVEQAREALSGQLMQARAQAGRATEGAESGPDGERYEILEDALGALQEQIGELAALREQVVRQADASLGSGPGGAAAEAQADFTGERPKGKLIAFSPVARAPR